MRRKHKTHIARIHVNAPDPKDGYYVEVVDRDDIIIDQTWQDSILSCKIWANSKYNFANSLKIEEI